MMAKRMGYRDSDPTALKALSRVYRQERKKRRQEVLREVRKRDEARSRFQGGVGQ